MSRRGLIDMRKRFRGNQPLSIGKEPDTKNTTDNQQLYAGGPAFRPVKETSGDEAQMDPEKTRGL